MDGRVCNVVRARIRLPNRNVRVNIYGLCITVAIQILTIPVLIEAVGVNMYALWLIVTAVPQYLTLGDLGVSASAVTHATYAVVHGNTAEARAVLQAAWRRITILTIILLAALFGGAIFVLPRLTTSSVSSNQLLIVFLLQLVWVFAWTQLGVCEGACRADNFYAQGITALNWMRLFEFFAMACTVLLSRSLIGAAIALVLVRSAGAWIIYKRASRLTGWFSLRWKGGGDAPATKLSAGSAAGYAAFPLGYALLNQGLVIVGGSVLSHQDLVSFTVTRTLANTIQQLTLVVTLSSTPRLTRLMGENAMAELGATHRKTLLEAVSITAAATLVLTFGGRWIIAVWTSSHITISVAFLFLMLATTLADVRWQVDVNLLRAADRVRLVGFLYIVSSSLVVVSSALFARRFGITVFPLCLFITDVLVTPVAYRLHKQVLRGGRSLGKNPTLQSSQI